MGKEEDHGERAPACPAPAPITVLVASAREPMPGPAPWKPAGQHGIRVTARVSAAALLLPALQRHMPQVLLLDRAIYDELDARSLAQMRARCPYVRVLLVCESTRPGLAEEILRNRFYGSLLDCCSPEAWRKAVRAVSRGEIWLPRALLSEALLQFMPACMFGDASGRADGHWRAEAGGMLTGREAQVAEFLRQGLTNKEIARRLGIMEDTVKKHLQGVFGKLGVRRRALVALDRPPGQANVV